MKTIFLTTTANFALPAATTLITDTAAQHGFDNIKGMTIGLPVHPEVVEDIGRVSASQALQMGPFYSLAHWATQLGAKIIPLAPQSHGEAAEEIVSSSPIHDAPVHEYVREQVEGPLVERSRPQWDEPTTEAEHSSSPIEQERPFYEEALNDLQRRLIEMAQRPLSTDAVIKKTVAALSEKSALNMLILEHDTLHEVWRRLPQT